MRQTWRKLKGSTSIIAIVAAAAGAFMAFKLHEMAADAEGEKACPSILQGSAADARDAAASVPAAAAAEPNWAQRGGTINDASCLDRVDTYGVVAVHEVADIARTLAFARANGLKVTAAGVRHSMGGQAFHRGGIVLDMRRFNRMSLNAETRTLTVQSGATWHDIQIYLHPRFAVRAMQSTDIFTVGGSISVNAHGMDHQAGAMAQSIKALRVMLADGTIEEITRNKNGELFDLVVGGYGLFGIILEADLDVADNVVYQTGHQVVDYKDFASRFAEVIEGDKRIGLMYAHLSTAPSSFLRETLIYTYTQVDAPNAATHPLGEVGGTKILRLMLSLAKKNNVFKELKWLAEKRLLPRYQACTVARAQALGSGEACLVTRNDPMHDSVAYLRNRLRNDTDILHEYFIARDQFVPFVDGLRRILLDNAANVLNVSVRVVHEETNALTYSPQESFSIVLYLNQTADEDGNRRMRKVTTELIDLTLAHGGRFSLAYQLHYSAGQLKRAYPQIGAFFAAKRKYDPDAILTNTFHARYAAAVLAQ